MRDSLADTGGISCFTTQQHHDKQKPGYESNYLKAGRVLQDADLPPVFRWLVVWKDEAGDGPLFRLA
jgi:hypothetical protein